MLNLTSSLFVICLLVVSSVGQTGRTLRFFCSYGEENRGAELCAEIRKETFKSNEHAERAVDMMLRPLGLKRNFVLVQCSNIENAVAVTYDDGLRYIVYDNAFMERIDRGANTDWASVSILAHEVGHHLQGHTLRPVSLQQRRENELEADEFSGFTMFKLGRSLDEAQAAMRNFPDVADEERSTHPKKLRRLEAIRKGYEDARSQQPQPQPPDTGRGSNREFVIDSPSNAATVGLTTRVHGRTPYFGKNHYIVAISSVAQRNFIQQPVLVRPDGTWEGTAAFGTQNYGIGHRWSIRVFVTNSNYPVGELFQFPGDAIFSNEIIVTRSH